MKQLTRFIGIIFVVLGIYSCSEISYGPEIPSGYLDYMPEETSIGANTFGCYVNGNIAAAQGRYKEEGVRNMLILIYVNGFWNISKSSYQIPDTWMYKDTIVSEMKLSFYSKNYTMKITIANDPVVGTNDCTFYIRCDTMELPRVLKKSSVDITTLDKENQIISGRFSEEVDLGDFNVHITKGQFDIKYGKNF